MTPAMVFHPSEIIREECAARRWTLSGLAARSVAPGGDWAVEYVAHELYLTVGPDDPDVILGNDGAAGLERAFGISAAFWLSIERQWRENPAARSRLLVPFDPDNFATFAQPVDAASAVPNGAA